MARIIRITVVLGILPLFTLMLTSSDAHAQGAPKQLVRYVIASGGGVNISNGSLVLSGTVGQPGVGTIESATMSMHLGFWQPMRKASSVSNPGPGAPVADQGKLRNFPNPFATSTTISYNVETPSHVRINIYDMSGQLVKTVIDERQSAGQHSILWDGSDMEMTPVASGQYVYTLDVQPVEASAKPYSQRNMMMLMK